MKVGFILFSASVTQNECVAHSLYFRVYEEREMDNFLPDGIYIYIYIYIYKLDHSPNQQKSTAIIPRISDDSL